MLSLVYDPTTGECDLVLEASAYSEADPLYTAALLSLFQDRRVSAGELPDGVDRGGWWGQAYAEDPADVEGSRLWTLPVTGRADALTARAAEGHAREALAWMVPRRAVSVTATAAVTQAGVIELVVRIVAADDMREVLLSLRVV